MRRDDHLQWLFHVIVRFKRDFFFRDDVLSFAHFPRASVWQMSFEPFQFFQKQISNKHFVNGVVFLAFFFVLLKGWTFPQDMNFVFWSRVRSTATPY